MGDTSMKETPAGSTLLDSEKMLFQAILDNAPLGIWFIGLDGRMQFVNKTFCAAMGIPEGGFLAAKCYVDVMPSNVAAGFLRSDEECLTQNGPHQSLEWLPFVDGKDHLMEITRVKVLDKAGLPMGLIGLAADVTQLKQHAKQLERIAHFDALTDVPNRVLFADRLRQALAHSKRENSTLAVCYLDLDGFKIINDTMGHDAGDRVLIEVTKRIKATIRVDDTVARLGGDEFAVLLQGLHATEECSTSLNRLLEAIGQPIEIKGKLFEVSASIGVTQYPGDEYDADTLLRHADQAMYSAKQSGKNRYHLYDAASDRRTRTHHEFLKRLAVALVCSEFALYYQPKVDLHTRRFVGAEALIRWNHPERGVLAPAEFLHAVEGTTLEVELGDWVIATALKQLESWHKAGLPLELSINISARHLQSTDFAWKLKRKLLRHPLLPKGCLQVEILETAALGDIPRVSDTIERCNRIGVGFALDDFGTGYSSLSYLGRLPVDTLKIDQSFIRDMLIDNGDKAIVQGVIALAKAFDRRTVAEGIETEELFHALVAMGCEYGQGYGIARPMPAEELPAWLEKWNSAPFR